MESKEEWQELEQWAETQKQNKIDDYKIDITDNEQLRKETKKVDRIFDPLNRLLKKLKTISKLLAFLVISVATIVFVCSWADMGQNINPNVSAYFKIEGVEIKVISKDVDEKGNGTYILEPKKNQQFQFIAIKKWGHIEEDFQSNLQKYLFNNWESERKEVFSVKEEKNERGVLNYQNYIVVDEAKTIEQATEDVISFIEYAENWNKKNNVVHFFQQKNNEFIVPVKNIYIKIQESEIYPYNSRFQTADSIRKYVSEETKKIKQTVLPIN